MVVLSMASWPISLASSQAVPGSPLSPSGEPGRQVFCQTAASSVRRCFS